jgi:hypothetical protein
LGYRDEKSRARVFRIGHSPVLYELALAAGAANGAKGFDWGNTAPAAELLSLAILTDYLADDERAARLNRPSTEAVIGLEFAYIAADATMKAWKRKLSEPFTQNTWHYPRRPPLLAECILLTGEDAKNFDILIQNHKRRFQPADGIEFGLIEEMCAAYWLLHRVWTIETHTLNQLISTQPAGSPVLRVVGASGELAALPGTALMQRYETRLQDMYARAIRTFKLLKPSQFQTTMMTFRTRTPNPTSNYQRNLVPLPNTQLQKPRYRSNPLI